jgi:LacI family transcriptional regulator
MEMLANRALTVHHVAVERNPVQGDFHHISEVIDQGPVVMFDRVTNEILCDKVIIDDKQAAYEAVQSLIDKGRKKIARHHR